MADHAHGPWYRREAGVGLAAMAVAMALPVGGYFLHGASFEQKTVDFMEDVQKEITRIEGDYKERIELVQADLEKQENRWAPVPVAIATLETKVDRLHDDLTEISGKLDRALQE